LPTEADAPAGTVVINADAEWTKSATVSLALAAEDASPPIQVCVSNTASCSSWTAFVETRNWTLSSGNGLKTVRVWFRDTWGNTTPAAAPVSDTIGLDTVQPSNGGISVTQQDRRLDVYWYGFEDAQSWIVGFRAVFQTGSSPPPSCDSGTLVPGYDGIVDSLSHYDLENGTIYSYRICAIDAAGNMSTGVTASSMPVPETNPPTGWVMINYGDPYTGSPSVWLSLMDVWDDSGEAIQMCISNTENCSSWVPLAESTSWTLLGGSGERMVRVWFRDQWGNTSVWPASDSIFLDTVAPTNGAVQVTSGDAQLTLNWTGFADAQSGVVGYKVVYEVGSVPPSCNAGMEVWDYNGTSTTVTHLGLDNGMTYGYRVCAIDAAGTMSSGVSFPVKETTQK
jgi:hypothetical protein